MSDKEEVFEFLDDLRESGITNMYGARLYIQDQFPEFDKDEAKALLMEWMRTFEERHQILTEKKWPWETQNVKDESES